MLRRLNCLGGPGAFENLKQNSLLEQAQGGTLLDEVGDMSHALQSKLLRLLQDGKFLRIGDGDGG